MSGSSSLARSLRTPRAAAISGLVFALLFSGSIVLLRLGFPYGSFETAELRADAASIQTARWGLMLVPYAGIAFLWFIGSIRHFIGTAEDKLFATVFLGSGLLFLALYFTAAAFGAAELAMLTAGTSPGDSLRILSGSVLNELLINYGARMAAVFVTVVTTIGRRSGRSPLWLTVVGYAAGISLLLVPIGVRWVELIFPAWVLIFSTYIFVRSSTGSHPQDA